MHPENVHYLFGAGDFNSLLISKESESKQTVQKTLRYTTLRCIPVIDIATLFLFSGKVKSFLQYLNEMLDVSAQPDTP